MLMDKGYRNVRPLAGGLDAWIEKGYPVDDITIAER
jgi:rhodanese-related sulfurtransferase